MSCVVCRVTDFTCSWLMLVIKIPTFDGVSASTLIPDLLGKLVPNPILFFFLDVRNPILRKAS